MKTSRRGLLRFWLSGVTREVYLVAGSQLDSAGAVVALLPWVLASGGVADGVRGCGEWGAVHRPGSGEGVGVMEACGFCFAQWAEVYTAVKLNRRRGRLPVVGEATGSVGVVVALGEQVGVPCCDRHAEEFASGLEFFPSVGTPIEQIQRAKADHAELDPSRLLARIRALEKAVSELDGVLVEMMDEKEVP